MPGAQVESVVCPALIGRAADLEILERTIGRVMAGRGQTVLLAGEAGIGKSRLMAEAAARAARRGMVELRGACFEADRAVPYAPIAEALRGWPTADADAELAVLVGPAAGDLADLLPDLAARLPARPPVAAVEPAIARHRLFHALFGALTRLAARQPVLVIVEDLHWADDASLAFLQALATRLPAHRLLLALTYRSDEIGPALSHLLAALDRARVAVERRLAPLDADEVAAMERAIVGPARAVTDAGLDRLFRLTEGNPFFVEEALRTLGAPDRWPAGALAVPRTIQDAVRRQAARLSPAARRTASSAAVAGRRFDVGLVQAALGLGAGPGRR
jgi:predicted ATPase